MSLDILALSFLAWATLELLFFGIVMLMLVPRMNRLGPPCEMMEFGLEAIGEQLQGDGLRPLSNDELGGLVRAIFQDSPGRSAILDAIGQGLA